ncbi:MAG: hypothetical protein V1793_12990 [Pseudomonadota bacterium]
MKPENMTLEDLLPHRNKMLLIDEILDVDESATVSKSVVTGKWPLAGSGSVSPIVLIELAAQTAGINNSIKRIKDRGKQDGNMGWIVGIKSAVFYVDAIPMGATVITRTQNSFCYEDFREITGTVTVEGQVVGEITLQLVSA